MILTGRALAVALAVATLLGPSALGASKYKVLHHFGAAKDGAVPSGALLLDIKGNLYGVTGGGPGQYGYGLAFGLMPQANGNWKETILHTFASADGSPWGAFIRDRAGNLYGTTVGGPISNSEVFELSPTSRGWSYSILYTNGAGPGLLMDRVGNLYGAIGGGNYFGIGAIGDLSRGSNGWAYADLFNFNPTVGYAPPAPPIWDGKGNLYGTTSDGGISQPACWTSFGCGVLFKMTPNADDTWTYHILHRFASFRTDGQTPDGGLVLGASGGLYGVTGLGGVHNQGTVFKFAFIGGHWKQTVLYDFPNCADGCFPGRTLAFDKLGNLYGVSDGGLQDCGYTCGVVFKLTPQTSGTWTYSVLHKFTGKDGAFPWGVIVDDKGNIFGTTENGGTYNSGVAFEITP
ncbi:MAG TPA: choice-of-anchor tandem repeat GloVer-containing protein [Terriglobales bacterium]|nr:choice-of-anchor tandem repeat GloVer-containing protein [Terriglobales bacterium]